jgi:hypothetical protein
MSAQRRCCAWGGAAPFVLEHASQESPEQGEPVHAVSLHEDASTQQVSDRDFKAHGTTAHQCRGAQGAAHGNDVDQGAVEKR